MSNSDPMIFAARVAAMTDADLYDAFRSAASLGVLSDYHRAVLDEAQIRGMISGSEADAMVRSGD